MELYSNRFRNVCDIVLDLEQINDRLLGSTTK